MRTRSFAAASAAILLIGCGPDAEPATDNVSANAVSTSGKSDVAVEDVPPGVVAAVRSIEPELTVMSVEAETRDGRRYYDVGGTSSDGSEIELDVMEENGSWRVVETQRDIAFAEAPPAVRTAANSHDHQLVPTRVIESRQADGLVIYELFAPQGNDPHGRKVEIKWDGRDASVLAQEWAH